LTAKIARRTRRTSLLPVHDLPLLLLLLGDPSDRVEDQSAELEAHPSS
jgi:hypothetical protein